MDAVGHMGDGDLRHRDTLPALLPHMAGDHAVQGADAVGLHGILEGQDGHLEDVAFAAFKAAHVDQGLPADAHGLDIGLEIGLHAFQRKALVAGIHGRVGREQGAAAHDFAGFFEGQAVFLHQQADALEDEEGRMPLVHVIGGRADVQGAQHAHAAPAQQDLLPQADIAVRFIQAGRDLAVLGRIGRQIGVQQVEPDPPHTHQPDLDVQAAARHLEIELAGFTVRVLDLFDGQRGKIVFGIDRGLVAVLVDELAEVAVLVQQAHGHQRDVQVTGGFQMVTGKDPQATGVDGQAFAQAVFCGKIGQRLLRGQGAEALRRFGHVGVEGRHGLVVQAQVVLLVGHDDQPCPCGFFQCGDGIVVAALPFLFIEGREQMVAFGMPAPPEVVGQFPQAVYDRGQ